MAYVYRYKLGHVKYHMNPPAQGINEPRLIGVKTWLISTSNAVKVLDMDSNTFPVLTGELTNRGAYLITRSGVLLVLTDEEIETKVKPHSTTVDGYNFLDAEWLAETYFAKRYMDHVDFEALALLQRHIEQREAA
jgi:non-homologous end joining protein Ku